MMRFIVISGLIAVVLGLAMLYNLYRQSSVVTVKFDNQSGVVIDRIEFRYANKNIVIPWVELGKNVISYEPIYGKSEPTSINVVFKDGTNVSENFGSGFAAGEIVEFGVWKDRISVRLLRANAL